MKVVAFNGSPNKEGNDITGLRPLIITKYFNVFKEGL